MEERLTEIAEHFKNSIDLSKQEGDGMDTVSWHCQMGVLISPNDAKLLLSLIEEKLNKEQAS